MPLETFRFKVSRLSDKSVVRAVQDAVQPQFTLSKITLNLLLGPHIEGLPGSNTQIDQVLDEDSVVVQVFIFYLNNGSSIQINREIDPNKSLIGYQDTLIFNPERSSEDAVPYIGIVKRLRKNLNAIDDKAFMDFVKDEDKAFYQSREDALIKLQEMQEQFFDKLQNFTTQQAERYNQKHIDLENRYSAKEKELEEAHATRLKELNDREGTLKNREKDLDDRANTHVRREIQRDFKKTFVDRSNKFELTAGAKRRRIWVFLGYLSLLGLLGTIAGTFLFKEPTNSQGLDILSIVRQIIFSLGFIVTAGFFIRWLNNWAQAHADEEFRLKKLELDIDRASWVVEYALEWTHEKGAEIPEQLIDRLSKNLFSEDSKDREGATAADALAVALLKSAKNLKLNICGNELEFGDKGIKNLGKREI